MSSVSKSQLFNFAILPVVMVIFFALRIVAQTHPEIDAWIPRWDRLMLFAAVIFAILAGGELFGFTGVLLALPVAAVIMVLVRHVHDLYKDSDMYSGVEDPEL